MRSYFNLAVAPIDRTISRYSLAARIVFLPMIEPATATTVIFAGAVYIIYPHGLLYVMSFY